MSTVSEAGSHGLIEAEFEVRHFDLEECPVDVVTVAEGGFSGTTDEDSFIGWAKEQAEDLRNHV